MVGPGMGVIGAIVRGGEFYWGRYLSGDVVTLCLVWRQLGTRVSTIAHVTLRVNDVHAHRGLGASCCCWCVCACVCASCVCASCVCAKYIIATVIGTQSLTEAIGSMIILKEGIHNLKSIGMGKRRIFDTRYNFMTPLLSDTYHWLKAEGWKWRVAVDQRWFVVLQLVDFLLMG